MKLKHVALFAFGLALATAQTGGKMEPSLQKAIQTEMVDGNLKSAIKQYGDIVDKYRKTDRTLAATALVRLAEAHQKLGNAEARKFFEQVVKEFGDQKEAVTTARAHLGTNEPSRRQTNTLVWSGQKLDTEGMVSPDGRFLSHIDWDTGDLTIREIATGQGRRLTNTGNPSGPGWSSFAEESAISRDGKQVAFSWYNKGNDRYELRLANLSGEPNPRRLYDDPANEWLEPRDWSPDNKSIVVLIARKDKTDCLGLVSVADGSLRSLRTGSWAGNTRIFFSPDGRYLGYDLPQGNSSQPRDLFVFDLQAAREVPAVLRNSHEQMIGWSPDSRRLLFASDRNGSSLGLWALPFFDGKPQGRPELIKSDVGNLESLGVTVSGTLYYGLRVGAAGSSVQVASIDFATGKISSSQEVSSDSMESNQRPWWSPDGKLLAYHSTRGPSHLTSSFIAIRSAETNQLVRELPARIGEFYGWTPDGRGLLGRGMAGYAEGTYRIDATTAEETRLVEGRTDSPSMSPDGKTLYFKRPVENDVAFFARDLTSGAEKQLIRRTFLGETNLSPDGKYLATPSVDVASNSRVFLLIPTAGGEVREVMRVPSGVAPEDLKVPSKGRVISAAFWAADSSGFLSWKNDRLLGESGLETWHIPIAGGAPRKLDSPIPRNAGFLKVHPDGRRVAYVRTEPGSGRRTEVWALENFLSPANK